MPSGPAQDTYISPLGPTAGTAPSTVPQSSKELPASLLILLGIDQLLPASIDFENRIILLSKGLSL
jgi:hypothetical protein